MIPWLVIPSPTDAEMSAVHGAYLVADNLPIEDAHLIAAVPDLLAALEALIAAIENQRYGDDRMEDDIYGAAIVTDSPYTVARAAIAKARNTPALHGEQA